MAVEQLIYVNEPMKWRVRHFSIWLLVRSGSVALIKSGLSCFSGFLEMDQTITGLGGGMVVRFTSRRYLTRKTMNRPPRVSTMQEAARNRLRMFLLSRPKPAERLTTTPQTTPSDFIRANSSAATPHSSRRTSSECSPSSGGRVMSAGESDSFTGHPTVWYEP